MIAELVATIVCTAAGSYATYELVTRHLSVHFDEILQQVKHSALEAAGQRSAIAAALENQMQQRHEELKQTHLGVMAASVKQEIKNVLSTATVETCHLCKRLVAGFENIDGKITCYNCAKAGK